MQKPLVHEKTPLKVVMVAIVAALGGFLFGFDSAVINGAVDAVQQQFGLGSVLLGFTVSCALLGAMTGAWLSGPLADRQGGFGRCWWLRSSLRSRPSAPASPSA